MGASVVAWALDAMTFLLVARALDIELGYPEAILIGAIAVLSTAMPAAPGYVGTFELAATGTATALGVPRTEALAMAILVHVIVLVPIAVAGAVVMVGTGSRLSSLAEEAEELQSEEHGDGEISRALRHEPPDMDEASTATNYREVAGSGVNLGSGD